MVGNQKSSRRFEFEAFRSLVDKRSEYAYTKSLFMLSSSKHSANPFLKGNERCFKHWGAIWKTVQGWDEWKRRAKYYSK